MECFKYAFNILTVTDGIYSINPGGLQADLMWGVQGFLFSRPKISFVLTFPADLH